MKLLWEKVRYIVTWEWLNLNTLSTLVLSMIFEEVDEDASIHQVFQPQSFMISFQITTKTHKLSEFILL